MDLKIIADVGVSVFVISSFMSLFTFIIKKEFLRLNQSISGLSKFIGKTTLTASQQETLFELVMQVHVIKKVKYIKSILEENNLKERETIIKNNIETIFKEITQKEISFLSGFNCVYCYSLQTINWNSFLSEIYSILWNSSSIPQKLSDCEILMSGYISEMVSIINNKKEEV